MSQTNKIKAILLDTLYDDLDVIGASGLPKLKNTLTTKKADKVDRSFAKTIDSLGKAFAVRGTKLTLIEKKKMFKMFYEHTKNSFILGREYSNKVIKEKNNPLSDKELTRINRLTKESLASWLANIEGNLL